MDEQLPLRSIKVLDLSSVLMGPYATLQMADMGAEVIKIEPLRGEVLRHYHPYKNPGMNGVFMNLYRNKKSVAIDLKHPDGNEAFRRLVTQADVVVHNFRPSVAERLNIAYSQLAEINPGLVYCQAYGFGSDGPYGEKPAYDDLIQAASGLTSMYQRVRGDQEYVPSMVSDKTVGLMITNAVLGALVAREKSGKGCEIEVPMFESMVSFNLMENQNGQVFEPPIGEFGWTRTLSTERKPFKTKDGFACLLPYSDQNWRDFLTEIGSGDLMDDVKYSRLPERVRHIDDLYALVREAAPTKTTSEWIKFCDDRAIPAVAVNDLPDLWSNEHLLAVDFFQTMQHPTEGEYKTWRSPFRFGDTYPVGHKPAPTLSQDTVTVLSSAGYTLEEIELLAGSEAILLPKDYVGATE
ncbi:CaiB/BaiF CoA transferase family protein [Ruegeria atlantica]|uniref:CaiB/BaiF CoA transferase family protein n=1 Tax=Ruegeria atlantica TaxID=81569 RepID=UPI00147F5423|nr:CoA transferase [Ruegeria atlantica]